MPHIGNYRITVGLLGGSFNPAHAGHRYISLEAMKRLGLDQVWWLVSPQNPLKSSKGMLPLEKREYLAKKCASHPKIIVTSIEKQLHTCYTRDTLRQLQRKYPKIRFVWLMGLDNMVQFPQWYKWRDISATMPIAVFDRESGALQALAGMFPSYQGNYRVTGRKIRCLAYEKPPIWTFVALKKHKASSTHIRNNWAKLP